MRQRIRTGAALLLAVLLLGLAGFAPRAAAAEPTGEGFVIPELDDLPRVNVKEDPLFELCNAYNSIGLEYTLEEFGGIGGQSLNPIAVEDTIAMRDAAALCPWCA